MASEGNALRLGVAKGSNRAKRLLSAAEVGYSENAVRPHFYPCPAGGPGTETQGQSDSISRGLCAQLAVQERSGTGFSESGAQETKETGSINLGRTCCRSGPADRAINLGGAACDVPLKRVFEIDISVCPLCGGTLRVIAGGRHRMLPIRT